MVHVVEWLLLKINLSHKNQFKKLNTLVRILTKCVFADFVLVYTLIVYVWIN